ncbi:MAG: class I SAM-dependent methyltransferase [Candidatus Falkowbacteria bacterium]
MEKNIWEKEEYYKDIENTHSDDLIKEDSIFLHFIELLKENKPASVLDVGCGEGWLIDQFSKRVDIVQSFTGIDVSSIGLKRAEGKNISKAKFIHYDGRIFPFTNNSFDVALSSFVFEHLSDPMTTFNEMSRVVKPGGLIIIACPNFGSPLFKSPCNKENRLLLMVSRFFKEFMPRVYFKNDFYWNKVVPIELPAHVHISDYDTLCEPSLSSFQKFLINHKDKYSIVKIDSLWDSYDYDKIFTSGRLSLLKKGLVNLAKNLGLKKMLRFQYFGSFFFVAIKKV